MVKEYKKFNNKEDDKKKFKSKKKDMLYKDGSGDNSKNPKK